MKSLVFCVVEAIFRFGQASTRHDGCSRKYRQLSKLIIRSFATNSTGTYILTRSICFR